MLASHSGIMSFPETHFFGSLAPKPWFRPGPIVVDPKLAGARFAAAGDLLGVPEAAESMPAGSRLKRRWVRSFVEMLDRLTSDAGKDIWIEKTPEHLALAPMIQRYITDSVFVHILRDGQSVVGSLIDVTRKHPERWGGQWSAEKCTTVWNRAVKHHRRLMNRPGHVLVRYETLAAEPERTLRRLCDRLGLAYEPSMLSAEASNSVIAPDEQWKASVGGGSRGVAPSKLDNLLSEPERRLVVQRLADISDIRGIGDE